METVILGGYALGGAIGGDDMAPRIEQDDATREAVEAIEERLGLGVQRAEFAMHAERTGEVRHQGLEESALMFRAGAGGRGANGRYDAQRGGRFGDHSRHAVVLLNFPAEIIVILGPAVGWIRYGFMTKSNLTGRSIHDEREKGVDAGVVSKFRDLGGV